MQTASMPARIRVVVADDHLLMRIGVVSMLEQDPLLEVVGEAQDGHEAVLLGQSLQPDVVLMDIAMPGINGLDAARRLRASCPRTSVLILTATDSEALLREAVNAGAAGYLLKTVNGEQLCRAVHDVASGMFAVDHTLVYSALTNQVDESDTEQAQAADPEDVLTNREREVLTLLARGMSNREIAERLVITTYTAKAHVEHILRKLGVNDRTHAAVRALELGYVSRTD